MKTLYVSLIALLFLVIGNHVQGILTSMMVYFVQDRGILIICD